MMRLFSFGVALCLMSTAAWSSDARKEDYLERMKREHATDSPVASPAAQEDPASNVESRDVDYADIGGSKITGYLATPTEGNATAGIIVIHEWWGLNDNIRAMTRRLAGEGYATLAVDLYAGEVAETREDALRLAKGSRDRAAELEQNLRSAWDYLEQKQGVAKVGVIGWCFGGGWSLRTALLMGGDIDATVIYYGNLVTSRKTLDTLESPVLGIFGALDQGIPIATVREFQSVLDSLGKEATVHIYEDANHAFANPSGTRYNERAAQDAWGKTLNFLARFLR